MIGHAPHTGGRTGLLVCPFPALLIGIRHPWRAAAAPTAIFRTPIPAHAFVAPSAHHEEYAMSKEELVELEGVVNEVLPQTRFRVTLDNGFEIIAYASGKMRKHRIRILAGDKVTIEMSPYDLTKGRINFRHKDGHVQAPRPAMPRKYN